MMRIELKGSYGRESADESRATTWGGKYAGGGGSSLGGSGSGSLTALSSSVWTNVDESWRDTLREC